jgi:hypothetical protein
LLAGPAVREKYAEGHPGIEISVVHLGHSGGSAEEKWGGGGSVANYTTIMYCDIKMGTPSVDIFVQLGTVAVLQYSRKERNVL